MENVIDSRTLRVSPTFAGMTDNKTMEIISKNAEQTQAIGRMLAETILNTMPGKQALVLALEGDLGGGKTIFVQGVAQGLGIRENLTSPTFVIMKSYFIPHLNPPPLQGGGSAVFYHLDCYRLKDENDLEALGIKEILADSKNIVAIEWAERVRKLLPKDAVKIKLEVIDENTRKIVLLLNC